ncbi:MAG TPA: asparagine synthase (glutamine-hydrolyzing) [Nitrospiraceae bacterium]|nr:asparagine synthase (glutamine-hydrolyzing) [Nitrospiraceae bacterium]
MCGIAGMVSLTDRPLQNVDLVRTMMDRLVHRGPDDSGVYVNNTKTVCLGHRRLGIIDLHTGRQPLGNKDGSVTVAFNGEIYGYQTLRRALEGAGHRFRTATDTEVIVHLYEDHGVEALHRLTGMFAIALWDDVNQSLLLARDRIGKKPLYYAVGPDALVFASEIDALTAVPWISRDIDELALDRYLTLGYIPAPATIYAGVQKLEAGEYLVAQKGDLQHRHYWSLSAVPPARPIAWPDAKAELVRHVREATRARLVSDVPIGCFLSGGVDSSIVLAMMAELSDRPVQTFSVGFADELYSELPYARTLARHFGTDHHEFVLEPNGVEVLDRLVPHVGEPFADSSCLPTWYLADMTRKSVTVALTGDGGDELFGGYGWYRTGRLLNRLAVVPPAAWRWIGHLSSLSSAAGLRRVARLADVLTLSTAGRYARLREQMTSEVKKRIYTPEFFARTQGEALGWLAKRYGAMPDDDSLNRMMAADLASYMAEDLLVKVDRMSMAHSLECRSPLLDSDVITWALQIPSTLKIAGPLRTVNQRTPAGGKWILREAFRDRFPEGFLERPKQGFGVPLERWFKSQLRDLLHERVLSGSVLQSERFNLKALPRLVEEHVEGRKNHASTLWALLVLSSWGHHYRVCV